jgi:hypothetical protein
MTKGTEEKNRDRVNYKNGQNKNSPLIKKGPDSPVDGEKLTGFAITLFNIIFMYLAKKTVISKPIN